MSALNSNFKEHITLINHCLSDQAFVDNVEEAINLIVRCYSKGNKVLFCGNGGSAADSAHLAGELAGKFMLDRAPLNAEALHVNSASLTAIANDYDFTKTYSRIIAGKAKPGDVLFALSTSGKSKNILVALEEAKACGMYTIFLTGELDQKLSLPVDLHIQFKSKVTPRIQEAMMLTGHHICQEVERKLFSSK